MYRSACLDLALVQALFFDLTELALIATQLCQMEHGGTERSGLSRWQLRRLRQRAARALALDRLALTAAVGHIHLVFTSRAVERAFVVIG